MFMDVYIGLFLVLFRSSLSIPSLILTAFSGCSKHTILGSIRIISQLISFELLTSTLVILVSFSFNGVDVCGWWVDAGAGAGDAGSGYDPSIKHQILSYYLDHYLVSSVSFVTNNNNNN